MSPPPLIRAIVVAACACLPLLLSGCDGDCQLEYAGAVTLDGQPLADGTIDFRSIDGGGPTAGALVTDGRYTVRLTPGKKVVVICGFRQVGEERALPEDPTSPLVPTREQISAQPYNEQSQTTIDVTSSRSDGDFHLSSHPQ